MLNLHNLANTQIHDPLIESIFEYLDTHHVLHSVSNTDAVIIQQKAYRLVNLYEYDYIAGYLKINGDNYVVLTNKNENDDNIIHFLKVQSNIIHNIGQTIISGNTHEIYELAENNTELKQALNVILDGNLESCLD